MGKGERQKQDLRDFMIWQDWEMCIAEGFLIGVIVRSRIYGIL